MTRVARVVFAVGALGGFAVLAACEQTAEAKVQVEKLPAVTPSLPAVPTIPPPPHPIQYDDQSYSVYGLRRHMRRTIDTEVSVTGYIAKIFVPPECPPKEKCPTPPAPHLWIADIKGESDEMKFLLVADYAENQVAIDEAIANEKKGKKQDLAELEGMGLSPIPTDFLVDAKVRLKGRFAYVSGGGFQSSEGVLAYVSHETLEPGTPPAEE